jgi:hypothetical protein
MSLPRHSTLVVALCCLAWRPTTNLVSAQEAAPATDAATNQAPAASALVANLKSEEVVASRPVRRAYISLGERQFAFMVPAGYRMDASNPEKVVLSHDENGSFITFNILNPAPTGQEMKREVYRAIVLQHHPGARINAEYPQPGGGYAGLGFDIAYKGGASAARAGRVVFLPSAAGILEFELSVSSDKLAEADTSFGTVVSSLRTNDGHKLAVDRISEIY